MIVTEYVPGERLSFRNLGALESTGTMSFESEGGGTVVTVESAARLTIPLIGRFLDFLLEHEMRKNIEFTLREVEKRHAKEQPAAA